MDMLSSAFEFLIPTFIGNTIDELVEGKLNGFLSLLCLEFLYLIINTINKYLDTKLYTKIQEKVSTNYFNKSLTKDIKNTVIEARLDMVDDITEYFEVEVPIFIDTAIGIIIPIWFLINKTAPLIVICAIVVSLLVVILTFKWQQKIVVNDRLRKDEREKEQQILLSRDRKEYSNYLKTIFRIDVDSSNTEAISYFWSYIIQLLLLACVLFLIIQANFTTGIIFATVTYIYRLNSAVLDIPNCYLQAKNVLDTANRLQD